MTIKNLDQLRSVILETIEKLQTKKIDVVDAGVLAKLSETVISGLKTQMEYARLTETVPNLDFMGDNYEVKLLESNVKKLLTHKK